MFHFKLTVDSMNNCTASKMGVNPEPYEEFLIPKNTNDSSTRSNMWSTFNYIGKTYDPTYSPFTNSELCSFSKITHYLKNNLGETRLK